MGNAPSVAELPPEWEDILPSVTREDIMRSAHKNCRIEEDESGKAVFLEEDIFELDEHVPMALAILRAAPHLKEIRFKLVPNKLKEERFWAALFGVLQYGGIDVDYVAGKINDDYETGDDSDDRYGREQSPPQSPHDQSHYDEYNKFESNADSTDTPPCYLEEIISQKALIHRLQKSLREANHKTRKLALELHKERTKRLDEDINSGGSGGGPHAVSVTNGSKSLPRCSSSPLPTIQQKPHTGKWEIHPDCRDFLQLDEHLKDNLRKEKQKRLNEVLSQMKFILDSDEIKDSYGKWSCCGEEEYSAEGCA